MALAAGAGWASNVLISPRVARGVGGAGLALAMLVANLFTVPFVLVAGGPERLDVGLLAAALAVAILSTALPMSLEFEALKRMSARAYGTLPQTALVAIGCVTAAAIGVTLSDRRSDGSGRSASAGRRDRPL